MNGFGSFSVAEKSSLSDRLSVIPPAVDGKHAVPPYLAGRFFRRAKSTTVEDFETDWARFAKEALCSYGLGNTALLSPVKT